MKKMFLLVLLCACIDSAPKKDIGLTRSTNPEATPPSSTGHGRTIMGPSSDGSVVEGPFLGSLSFEALSGAETLVQKVPGEISGTGLVRFVESFDRPRLDFNFWFSFGLPHLDSKVEVIVFSEDDMDQGIEMSFSRSASKDSMNVEITASGETEEISRFFRNYKNFSKIELSVDVHNAHSEFAHFIFWPSLQSNVVLTDSAAKFDSPGRGFGRRWGFRLHNSQILSARREKARSNH